MDIRETPAHPTGWKENGMKLVYEYGDDGEVSYPAKFIVCECCAGTGSCVNPSIDSHGLAQEDFDEDPDFREDYFNGAHDINCPHCEGKRVVLFPATEDGEKAYSRSQRDDYSYHAEIAAERRMGC
jgi:hypothetical protein